MAGWRLVLPLLKRRMPLPRLVAFMSPGRRAPRAGREREARVAELARIVFRSHHRDRSGNCLERSLVLYRYLMAAGADPHLRVGVRRSEGALRGHAWVTVEERALEEPPASLEEFTEVVSFTP